MADQILYYLLFILLNYCTKLLLARIHEMANKLIRYKIYYMLITYIQYLKVLVRMVKVVRKSFLFFLGEKMKYWYHLLSKSTIINYGEGVQKENSYG